MAGAYSVALFAGFAVTAYTLHRRLPERTAGPSAVGVQLRLLVAVVPAGALGYGAARLVAGAGDFVAAGVGGAVLLGVVVLLARPLGVPEIGAMLGKVTRRVGR